MKAFLALLVRSLVQQALGHEVALTVEHALPMVNNLALVILEGLRCCCGGGLAWKGGNRIVCTRCGGVPIRFASAEEMNEEVAGDVIAVGGTRT